MMGQIMDEVAPTMKNRVRFVKVDSGALARAAVGPGAAVACCCRRLAAEAAAVAAQPTKRLPAIAACPCRLRREVWKPGLAVPNWR